MSELDSDSRASSSSAEESDTLTLWDISSSSKFVPEDVGQTAGSEVSGDIVVEEKLLIGDTLASVDPDRLGECVADEERLFHELLSLIEEESEIDNLLVLFMVTGETELSVLVIGDNLVLVVLGKVAVSYEWKSDRNMVGVDSFSSIVEHPGVVIAGLEKCAGADIGEGEADVVTDALLVIHRVGWNDGALTSWLFIVNQ